MSMKIHSFEKYSVHEFDFEGTEPAEYLLVVDDLYQCTAKTLEGAKEMGDFATTGVNPFPALTA